MEVFEVGELVQLKSGGPSMTVRKVIGEDPVIWCQWFSGNKLNEGRFAPDSLEKVKGNE